LSFWETVSVNTIASVIGGVVSGLIVALALWWINHLNRPKFQYFDVGNGLGHFHYNRYWPIIIGGAWELGHGPAMIEQNRRALDGGFYMEPMSNRVFATGNTRTGLETGETFQMVYRYVPLKVLFSKEYRRDAWKQRTDPMEVFNAQEHCKTAKLEDSKPDNDQKKLANTWKMTSVALLPGITKAI